MMLLGRFQLPNRIQFIFYWLISSFYSGGLTDTKYHNRLNGVVFELLKSAYHNSHISTASGAKQHIDALIASFDDEFEGVDDEDLPELIDA